VSSIVGLTIFCNLSPEQKSSALAAQERALTQFKHLERTNLSIGESTLELWGHGNVSDRLQHLADGSVMALIGSPVGEISWQKIQAAIIKNDEADHFEPPWDGRFILIRISAEGKRWTLWNDWLGSIPLFHTRIGNGRIASTIEPVPVASAGYTHEDFFMPGLVSLLINGHFFSDWSLYKDMKTIAPDCKADWEAGDFRFKRLWTVKPSQDRWESGWNDLVDEMHELTQRAIRAALSQHRRWTLPLSSGLDSRLIAAVGADAGVDMQAYAWGEPHSTDVVNSHRIAQILGYSWKHIGHPKDFLQIYTKRWADWFGTGISFHGMYQMFFLDAIKTETDSPIASGFLGEVLAGDAIPDTMAYHSGPISYQIEDDGYSHWNYNDLKSAMRIPIEDALKANGEEIRRQIDLVDGARFQKLMFLELWARQRFFTCFQAILSDYWFGVTTPYLNRAYARFSLSLPRAVFDQRRLMADVFRRYYGRLAVIPGTYDYDPFILTGRYLINRRLARLLPPPLHVGPLKGFGRVPLRMDTASLQATGKVALWPLFEAQNLLADWVDVNLLERDFQTLMKSGEDLHPLRRLQAFQPLAWRLLAHKNAHV